MTTQQTDKGAVLIILGTAHGSNTPGKRSPDGRLREYRYSREIVAEVQRRLRAKGYEVETDLRQDYEPSLTFRVNVVNNLCRRHGAARTLYVSIHVNAAGMGDAWRTASYWSVWTSKGQTQGDRLATCLYDAAREVLAPMGRKVNGDFSDGDGDHEANFTVLAKTRCAAALTENFFQDCKADVDFLLSDEGREAVTELHVRGITRYVEGL